MLYMDIHTSVLWKDVCYCEKKNSDSFKKANRAICYLLLGLGLLGIRSKKWRNNKRRNAIRHAAAKATRSL